MATAAAIKNVRRSFSLSWLSSLTANTSGLPTAHPTPILTSGTTPTALSPHPIPACATPPVSLPSHFLTSGGSSLGGSNSAPVSRAMDLSTGNHLNVALKQQREHQQSVAGSTGGACGGDAGGGSSGSSLSCGSNSSNGGSASSTPSATPTPTDVTPTTNTTMTADGEKKYSCDHCDYTSSWPSHLRLVVITYYLPVSKRAALQQIPAYILQLLQLLLPYLLMNHVVLNNRRSTICMIHYINLILAINICMYMSRGSFFATI